MKHPGCFGSLLIISTALACPAGWAATPYGIVVASATSSPPSDAPAAMVALPAGPPALKLIGGGGRTNFSGAGSLLTTLGRSGLRNWTAYAKDHLSPDPATVTAYVLGITDPTDDWEVMEFFSAPSYVVNHPGATATLPPGMGWILLGGTCRDDWAATGTAGNMLTASFPSSTTSWQCRGKDHSVVSPAAVTADEAGTIVGWHAGSKDHLVASPGTVTAYAINLLFPPSAAAGEPSATGTPPPMVASVGKSSR